MVQISLGEAKEMFLNSDAKYVSQEQASVYYDNFSGRCSIEAFVSFNCLVIKADSDWHIHALSNESDVISAIQEVKAVMNLDKEKLMVLTLSNIPEELTDKRGAYKLSRQYKPYNDPAIRKLTVDDIDQVRACCAYDAEDNQIGKNIANDFVSYYNDFMNDPNTVNLGLYEENRLIGFVQSFEQKNMGLATVNIYVNRAERKKGYAKRLLNAICAASEDVTYCYSCSKTNVASMNTATSCGFIFKGTYLFI